MYLLYSWKDIWFRQRQPCVNYGGNIKNSNNNNYNNQTTSIAALSLCVLIYICISANQTINLNIIYCDYENKIDIRLPSSVVTKRDKCNEKKEDKKIEKVRKHFFLFASTKIRMKIRNKIGREQRKTQISIRFVFHLWFSNNSIANDRLLLFWCSVHAINTICNTCNKNGFVFFVLILKKNVERKETTNNFHLLHLLFIRPVNIFEIKEIIKFRKYFGKLLYIYQRVYLHIYTIILFKYFTKSNLNVETENQPHKANQKNDTRIYVYNYNKKCVCVSMCKASFERDIVVNFENCQLLKLSYSYLSNVRRKDFIFKKKIVLNSLAFKK